MTGNYAGDLSPRDAWAALELDPGAVLIDVRTKAEWSYVGLPDLAQLDKPVLKIEWQSWPDGTRNQRFVDEVADMVGGVGGAFDQHRGKVGSVG